MSASDLGHKTKRVGEGELEVCEICHGGEVQLEVPCSERLVVNKVVVWLNRVALLLECDDKINTAAVVETIADQLDMGDWRPKPPRDESIVPLDRRRAEAKIRRMKQGQELHNCRTLRVTEEERRFLIDCLPPHLDDDVAKKLYKMLDELKRTPSVSNPDSTDESPQPPTG